MIAFLTKYYSIYNIIYDSYTNILSQNVVKMYEEDQMRERIHKLIHRLDITPRAFAIEIGSQPNNIYKILSGERGIPKSFPSAILTKFTKVSKDWLMFGEGAMYKGEEQLSDVLHADTRPRLPKSISDGHLTDYYDGEKRCLCQEQDIVTLFSDYDFSMILKDCNMSPKYERGDELFFKKVTIVEWGKDYILDTFEGPKFAKVYDSEESYVCASYNTAEFPGYVVPKDKVFGFYRLVGALRIL